MGALPAILGILVLVIYFGTAAPRFLSAGNFANLLGQGAGPTIIAMGLVFVLLLGEIDLSAGYTSGLTAAIMTVLMTNHNVAFYLAIPAGILTGTFIGFVLGTLVSRVGIPSFVVTLAAFLAFQGLLLLVVHEGQIIAINDTTVLAVNNKNIPPWLGWSLYALAVGGYAAVALVRHSRRSRRGLVREPLSVILARLIALVAILGVGVYILNLERGVNPARTSLKGVPIVVPIVGVLLVLLTFVLSRTRYGLHLYAVGGNREAALRAGIPTVRLRTSAFVLCSTIAAIGGIVAASRDNSVSPTSGGSDVLLYAVGAAVIGGTSLFGGKGRILDAVLGGALVAIIKNGIPLVTSKSWVTYVVTGLVLLVAAGVDAFSRKRASSTGLI
jgi:D-xylose transport system permease protein